MDIEISTDDVLASMRDKVGVALQNQSILEVKCAVYSTQLDAALAEIAKLQQAETDRQGAKAPEPKSSK